jgi:hypothetical protein
MGRLIIGIVLGILAAFITLFCINLVGHQFYPIPSDLDLHDPEAVGGFIAAMPAGALAIVLIAWFAGALDGGYVAAAVSRRPWTVWPVAAAVAIGGIVNVLMIPHPVELQIGAVAGPLLGGFVAALLARMFVAPTGEERRA